MDNKVLVVFARELHEQISSQLAPLSMEVYFTDTLMELAKPVRNGNVFPVAVLPQAEATCRELFGELSLLSMKPELLICTRSASFRLWSSVLDSGGYDVLAQPFTPEELRKTVFDAFASFKERADRSKTESEPSITEQ